MSETVLMVYIGEHAGDDVRRVSIWFEVSDAQYAEGIMPADPVRRLFDKRRVGKHASPGMVYRFERGDQPNTVRTPPEYVGVWTNEAQRAEWRAADDARVAVLDLAEREAKDRKANALHEVLRPVRRAYQRAVGRERHVLLAQVVAYITRPGGAT